MVLGSAVIPGGFAASEQEVCMPMHDNRRKMHARASIAAAIGGAAGAGAAIRFSRLVHPVARGSAIEQQWINGPKENVQPCVESVL